MCRRDHEIARNRQRCWRGTVGVFVALAALCGGCFAENPTIYKFLSSQASDTRIVHVTWRYEASGDVDRWLEVPSRSLVDFEAAEDPVLAGRVVEYRANCDLLGQSDFGRVELLTITLPETGPPEVTVTVDGAAVPDELGRQYREFLTYTRC